MGAGAEIYSVDQVVADLQRFAMENPSTRLNISRLIDAVRVEGEVLIEGKAPNMAINPVSVAYLPYIQTAEEIFARLTYEFMS